MRRPVRVLPLSALLALAGCHARGGDSPSIANAWVRLPALPGRPGAAYLDIAGGAAPARLVAVDSAAAGASELHASMEAGGMATMRRLDGIDVAPGATVRLAPGGDHAMLFGLDPRLAPGASVPLTIRFAKGPTLAVTARAVGAGDAAPY